MSAGGIVKNHDARFVDAAFAPGILSMSDLTMRNVAMAVFTL